MLEYTGSNKSQDYSTYAFVRTIEITNLDNSNLSFNDLEKASASFCNIEWNESKS